MHRWRRADHFLPGWRRKQQPNQQRHHHLRYDNCVRVGSGSFPPPNRVGRAFESQSGQSTGRASSQEAMSQRRVCSSVRRGGGGVVGRTPRRSSDGSGDRTAPRGSKTLSIDDNSCRGVASIDSKPENSSFSVGEHSEVTMHQCGLLGVRVGEASNPGPRVREKLRRRLASSSDDEFLSQPKERTMCQVRTGSPFWHTWRMSRMEHLSQRKRGSFVVLRLTRIRSERRVSSMLLKWICLASTQRDSSEDDGHRFLEATQWDSGAEFMLTRASGECSPRSPDSVSFDPKPRQKDQGRGERPGVAKSAPQTTVVTSQCAIDVGRCGRRRESPRD